MITLPNNLLLIGDGGHARSCFDLCNLLSVNCRKISIEELKLLIKEGTKNIKDVHFFVCLGDINKRNLVTEILKKNGLKIGLLIHPNAFVSQNAVISEGTFIGANCYLGPNTFIGKSCIINTGSIIEHDSKVGSFTNIGPNSVLCGGTVIGTNCFLGASSTIIENLSIADNVLVAAGSVVIKNINMRYSKEKGVPSRPW